MLARWFMTILIPVCCFALCVRASASSNHGPFTLDLDFTIYGFSNSQHFLRPGGLFYDANRKELYVADSGNGLLEIFNSKGVPVDKIRHWVQSDVSGARCLGEPKNCVVLKNGDILLTDNLCAYVDVIDSQGRSLQKFWPADLLGGSRKQMMPRCLAIDAAENIYLSVAAGNESEILVLTPDFHRKMEIKDDGTEDGSLYAINGLWVDEKGDIYATSAMGKSVRCYAPDGKRRYTFGVKEPGPLNFSLPSGLLTDAHGNLWVVDDLRSCVSVFKQTPGRKPSFLDVVGDYGTGAGEFVFPIAIAGDGNDRIFVLENNGARVQAFNIIFAGDVPD